MKGRHEHCDCCGTAVPKKEGIYIKWWDPYFLIWEKRTLCPKCGRHIPL